MARTKKTKSEIQDDDIVQLQEPAQGNGKYYLTNKDLLPAVIEAKEKGYLTDKLARMLMLLADRYSKKSNFVGYTFREDMVASSLVNLAHKALQFDPQKSSNPFSFYTTSIHRSFLQFMAEEKKHRIARDKLLIKHGLEPSFNYTGYLTEKDRLKAEAKEKEKLEKEREDKVSTKEEKDCEDEFNFLEEYDIIDENESSYDTENDDGYNSQEE